MHNFTSNCLQLILQKINRGVDGDSISIYWLGFIIGGADGKHSV